MAGRMWHISGGLWKKINSGKSSINNVHCQKNNKKLLKRNKSPRPSSSTTYKTLVLLIDLVKKKKQSLDLTEDINYLLYVKAAVFKLRGETLEGVSVITLRGEADGYCKQFFPADVANCTMTTFKTPPRTAVQKQNTGNFSALIQRGLQQYDQLNGKKKIYWKVSSGINVQLKKSVEVVVCFSDVTEVDKLACYTGRNYCLSRPVHNCYASSVLFV